VAYVFVVTGSPLFLVAFMLAAGQSPFGYPPQAYLWFLLLALVPQARRAIRPLIGRSATFRSLCIDHLAGGADRLGNPGLLPAAGDADRAGK
jgi:hypothetical protein